MRAFLCSLSIIFLLAVPAMAQPCSQVSDIEEQWVIADFLMANSADVEATLKDILYLSVSRTLKRFDSYVKSSDKPVVTLPENFAALWWIYDMSGKPRAYGEFRLSLNRFMTAVARDIFVEMYRQIDALKISSPVDVLIGGGNSATCYLKRNVWDKLLSKAFEAADRYGDDFVGACVRLKANPATGGFIKRDSCFISRYVAEQTLGIIFRMMSEEERLIRRFPFFWKTERMKKFLSTVRYAGF